MIREAETRVGGATKRQGCIKLVANKYIMDWIKAYNFVQILDYFAEYRLKMKRPFHEFKAKIISITRYRKKCYYFGFCLLYRNSRWIQLNALQLTTNCFDIFQIFLSNISKVDFWDNQIFFIFITNHSKTVNFTRWGYLSYSKIILYFQSTLGLFEFLVYLWNTVVIMVELEDIGEILCSKKIQYFDGEL